MATPDEKIESGPDAGLVVRLVLFAAIFVYAVVFVLQNSTRVTIDFVFFELQSRLWLGFIASLLIGALLGFIATKLIGRGRKRP